MLPQTKERTFMDVYFGENYWGCQRDRHTGTLGEAVYLEERFMWEGREVRIPAVYVCEEGLVADLCVRIPAEEMESFYKKWKPRTEHLTEEEEMQLSRENPFSWNASISLQINGENAEQESGCGTSWVPPYLKGDEASAREDADELLMEAYGCDCTAGWSFRRCSYRWPEGKQVPLRTLQFHFEKEPVSYAGIHFTTRLSEEKKQVEFWHPVSQKKHVLTVQSQFREEVPAKDLSEMNGRGFEFKKFPTHFLVMEYTVEPELPMDEFCICDCAESDPPVMVRKRAASVSIIGGADGPTSVFFAGKCGDRQEGWKSVSSSVHYEPVEEVEWRIWFQVKSEERKEVKICL